MKMRETVGSLWGRVEGMRVHLPPIDEGRLKILAVAIMLIDHVTYSFLEVASTDQGIALRRALPFGMLLDRVGRAVGRQAFPIFCFFLVEGFLHTRSRLRYLFRLLVFAAVSQFPFQKAFFPRENVQHANVMVTLAIGLAAIWVIEELGKIFLKEEYRPGLRAGNGASGEAAVSGGTAGDARPDGVERPAAAPARGDSVSGEAAGDATSGGAGRPAAVFVKGFRACPAFGQILFLLTSGAAVCGFCLLANAMRSDYRYGGVIAIVLLYFFRETRIFSFIITWAWLSWYNRLEMYAAPAFFLLSCYNGKRGKQRKYFFYVFYPAHLLLLWLLRRLFFGI